jgi:hypothetical protein
LSWYEWSGFYIGSCIISKMAKAVFLHFPIMTNKKDVGYLSIVVILFDNE